LSLIVIEGLDASGKQTVSTLLANQIPNANRIEFPQYGNPSAYFVELYLSGEFAPKAEDVNPYLASLAYVMDRSISYPKWKPLLSNTVIADRYVTSNLLYQVGKLPESEWDDFIKWEEDLEYNKLQLPRPDKVVFLHLLPEISFQLRKERGTSDIHEADEQFLQHTHVVAMKISKRLGWLQVEVAHPNGTLRTPKEIADEIVAIIG
jgi:dTMP kinase